MLRNRCKYDGGMLHHFVVDYKGKNYYKCHTGLTCRGITGGHTYIEKCDRVYTEQGQEFHGLILLPNEQTTITIG